MRRSIHLPLYAIVVLTIVAVLGPVLSIYSSVQIADRNAERLVERYRTDQAKQRAENRAIYCALFSAQVDTYRDASTPVGEAAYQAWLDMYQLADCEQPR